MREDDQTDKEMSLARVDVKKDINGSPHRDSMLSFLHIAKLKADTILQVDSWLYNELMSLKKRVEKLQQN